MSNETHHATPAHEHGHTHHHAALDRHVEGRRITWISVGVNLVLTVMQITIGWIAQRNEMIEDPDQKIGRPRQLFLGEAERSLKPLADRR